MYLASPRICSDVLATLTWQLLLYAIGVVAVPKLTRREGEDVGIRVLKHQPRSWHFVAAVAALLVLVVLGHLLIFANAPPRFWGDERLYALPAQEDAQQGHTSLLPGTLGFEHRPLLCVRV